MLGDFAEYQKQEEMEDHVLGKIMGETRSDEFVSEEEVLALLRKKAL